MSDFINEGYFKGKPESTLETSEQAARRYARDGNFILLSLLIVRGELDNLEETIQRALLSESYFLAARQIEDEAARGFYHPLSFSDPDMAEAYEFAPRDFRARSLEVRLNPEGQSLKEQIEKFAPEIANLATKK